jgi:hypothetical protein
LTTYQSSKYSDFQTAILIYLSSEERYFRTEHLQAANQLQTQGSPQSGETVFPDSIKILVGDVLSVIPISAKPLSRRLADVSARLHELEQAGLLQRSIPFYQGTEYESYSITVQGSRYISDYLYSLIPIVTNKTRIRRALGRVEGFERAKSWLLDLGPRFKDRSLEELVNELLLGVRKYPATGINLLLVLGREAQSDKR